MTIDNICFRMIKRLTAFGCLLCLSSFVLWSCSSGGGGTQDAGDPVNVTENNTGSYSGKAMIGSSTGGAISVETDEGVQVMIDIPSGAMDYSKEITLTVSKCDLSGEYPTLSVRIDPAVALWESAKLKVAFPEGFDSSNMIVFRNSSELMPLKQGQSGGILIASLYRLGEFSCMIPDVEDMIQAAYGIIDQSPSGGWQESYASFDSLLWLCDYFVSSGNSPEAAECFSALSEKSLEQVETFVSSMGVLEKGGEDYRSLEKFKRLMVLCENPEDIGQVIDALLESVL